MEKVICLFVLVVGLWAQGLAQANLWSNYKYSDGIHLAPSLTGYKGGAIALSYRSSWTQVEGAPENALIIANTSVLQEKAGVGLVVNIEKNNVLEHLQIQVPLAYHLEINSKYGISFGLSPDIVQSRLNRDDITNRNMETDEFLNDYDNSTSLDFGFSSQLNHKYYEVGVSVQRVQAYSDGSMPAKMYGFANVYIPLRDEYDLLEPTIIVSRDNYGEWLMTGYLYYKFIDLIIVGAGYQSNNNAMVSLGVSIDNRVIVGYNYASHLVQQDLNLGNTHEVTARLNLNQRYYDQRKYSIFAKPLRTMKQR